MTVLDIDDGLVLYVDVRTEDSCRYEMGACGGHPTRYVLRWCQSDKDWDNNTGPKWIEQGVSPSIFGTKILVMMPEVPYSVSDGQGVR